MADETALVPHQERAEAPLVHLVARNPVEMQNAQADLARWLRNKLTEVEHEIRELNAALNEARENGWGLTALTRQRNKTVDLEGFYFKLLTAVEAGFTIIPEFPVDIFAIRCTRSHVKAGQQLSSRSASQAASFVPNEEPDYRAPVGEGDYRSPIQIVRGGKYQDTDAKGEVITKYFAFPEDFKDVVFPLRAARPEVMSATAKAMALKVFDQIGICPAKRKADPLIIGQVLGPKIGYTQKCIGFIIAWHINLNDL